MLFEGGGKTYHMDNGSDDQSALVSYVLVQPVKLLVGKYDDYGL